MSKGEKNTSSPKTLLFFFKQKWFQISLQTIRSQKRKRRTTRIPLFT